MNNNYIKIINSKLNNSQNIIDIEYFLRINSDSNFISVCNLENNDVIKTIGVIKDSKETISVSLDSNIKQIEITIETINGRDGSSFNCSTIATDKKDFN